MGLSVDRGRSLNLELALAMVEDDWCMSLCERETDAVERVAFAALESIHKLCRSRIEGVIEQAENRPGF